MKLQLDTENKTIKIENDIKVYELINTLKALLPKEWKNFTLKTNVTIQGWSNPIYIQPYIYPDYYHPSYPWYYTTCQNTSNPMGNVTDLNGNELVSNCSLKEGVYNVEVKDEKTL